MRFFTSDHHFGHANIIRFSNRPYKSLHDMDTSLIANWNSVVKPDDEVYHLGDMFFKCSVGYAHNILDQLNGKITVICGNHDKIIRNQKPIRDRFKQVVGWEPYILGGMEIPMKPWTEQRVILCHYKMQVWNKSHYGAWHLYGHSHNTEFSSCTGISANVCVERWNYFPVREDELGQYMQEKIKNWVSPFGKEKKGVDHF